MFDPENAPPSPPTGADEPDPAPDPALVLGHVTSTVVHSLVNVFTAIVSQAELIRLEGAGPGALERAGAMVETALKGSVLAQSLGEFSRRMTSPEATGRMGPVDLDALVADRAAAWTLRARPGVSIETHLSSDASMRGDPVQLRLMLDCLIENALDSLGPDGGSVRLSTGVDSYGWTTLEVRDDGDGASPEVLEKALTPFFTTKADRAGLGLTLARGVWRRHQGAFAIESEPGRGMLVRLSRPANPAPNRFS